MKFILYLVWSPCSFGGPVDLPWIHYQGFFHSVRRNPFLNCFHRRRSIAIIGHTGPRWRIRLSLHLVLGLPCRLVHSRGVHSVSLTVHLLSLNRAIYAAHPSLFCPGFQNGRVPSEKGTLARWTDRQKGTLARWTEEKGHNLHGKRMKKGTTN